MKKYPSRESKEWKHKKKYEWGVEIPPTTSYEAHLGVAFHYLARLPLGIAACLAMPTLPLTAETQGLGVIETQHDVSVKCTRINEDDEGRMHLILHIRLNQTGIQSDQTGPDWKFPI